MATFNWASGTSGDWNTGTSWTPATVPTGADDVVIDAANTLYTVTIATGEVQTVHSVMMNDVVGRQGTNDPNAAYHAAQLELHGTLAFAAGSEGLFGGSLQNIIYVDGGYTAELLNVGTINAFIQASGNLLMTGTNGVYITNELQALGGTVTIDTKTIAELNGDLLFDGIFDSKGAGAVINLGGDLQDLIVNIATVTGPPLIPEGWTELSFNDPTAQINQWNGTSYESVEKTLREIGAAGTVDVLAGRDYNTLQVITIKGATTPGIGSGIFNLQAGTVTTGGLNINGGVVQGYGVINSGVTNNGTLIALGGDVGGTLTVVGDLTGTGSVLFDHNEKYDNIDTTKGTLVVHSVSAGQTITMSGGDTLELANPGAFAGTISAGANDRILLDGVNATSATLNNGTLVISDGSVVVASLALSGNYAGDSIATNGSILTFGTTIAPAISGTTAGQAVADTGTVSPFANVTIQDANFAQTQTVTVTMSNPANGTFTNLGNGTYNPTTGVYTNIGTAAQVTADLHALLFTPTAHQVAAGETVTTTFTISDVDTSSLTASDATTSVVATAAAVVPPDAGTGDVLNLAAQITAQLTAMGNAGTLRLTTDNDASPPPAAPSVGPGTVNELVLSGPGGLAANIPAGYSYVMVQTDTADTIHGSNLVLVGGPQGGAYDLSGTSTVVATGGNNLIFVRDNFTVSTADGNNTVSASGTGLVATDHGANLIFAAGNTTILSIGQDTLVGGSGTTTAQSSGANSLIFGQFGGSDGVMNLALSGGAVTVSGGNSAVTTTLSGSNALVFGAVAGGGTLNVLDQSANDTISGLSSATTVTAGAGSSNLLVFGGSGGLTFVGGDSAATVVSSAGQNVVQVGNGGVLFAAGGNDVVTGGGGAVTLFGSAGNTVTYSSAGNLLYGAGAGNETLNAAGSTGNGTYFAGAGSDANTAIIGGSGTNIFVAGGGSDSFTGGAGTDIFDFMETNTAGHANFIYNMTAADSVNLIGYDPTKSTVSTAGGSTTLTLSDNTQITFVNLTSLPGSIHYG